MTVLNHWIGVVCQYEFCERANGVLLYYNLHLEVPLEVVFPGFSCLTCYQLGDEENVQSSHVHPCFFVACSLKLVQDSHASRHTRRIVRTCVCL
eukprot:scaffold48553_cov21-Tisochrysis_lutea.AAC.1